MIWLYAFAVIGYVIAGGVYASLAYRFTNMSQETALKGAFIWPIVGPLYGAAALFCLVATGTDWLTDWIEKKVSSK